MTKSFAAALIVLSCLVGCADPGAGGKADALARMDFRQVVRDATDKVFPAVVFVRVLQESHESGKKITRELDGSGVIISPTGEVLTNWHVVDKAVEVRCLLFDGQALDAEVVGSDKDTDLALLQLKLPKPATAPAPAANDKTKAKDATDAPDDDKAKASEDGATDAPAEAAPAPPDLPYAVLGSSKGLREGDFVMAMGAPWGLNRSVSIGIISSTTRFLPNTSEYSLWLQTDAAISPGNSGGPLVNTAGEIIGINTRVILRGGDTGFAVPADTVRIIVSQLREFGKVNWSWTGLQLQPLKDFNKNMYFEGDKGVIVAEAEPDSPARKAGVKQRDRILSINGEPVNAVWDENLPAARRRLGMLPKGKVAVIEVLRGAEIVPINLTPREKGKVEGEELDCPRWDLTVKAINQFDNPDLYFYSKKGVFIYGVKYPGNAATYGLGTEDIVLKIGQEKVATLADVKRIHKAALKNIQTTHRIVFTVLRNGLTHQVILDFSRDTEKE